VEAAVTMTINSDYCDVLILKFGVVLKNCCCLFNS